MTSNGKKKDEEWDVVDAEDIPNILDDAFKDSDLKDEDPDVEDLDDLDEGERGILDRFDYPDDLEKRDLDYRYKKGCALCLLCLDDPNIHETYRLTRNYKDVERYLNENYNDGVTPIPQYSGIINHIKKHFLPEENKRTGDMIVGKARVEQKSRELAEKTRTHEVNDVRAMAWIHLENIAAIDRKSRAYHDYVKLFPQIAKVIKDFMELDLKLLGLDKETTPEEQEKRMKNWLLNIVGLMKEEDPEMAKKMASFLQKVNVPM